MWSECTHYIFYAALPAPTVVAKQVFCKEVYSQQTQNASAVLYVPVQNDNY